MNPLTSGRTCFMLGSATQRGRLGDIDQRQTLLPRIGGRVKQLAETIDVVWPIRVVQREPVIRCSYILFVSIAMTRYRGIHKPVALSASMLRSCHTRVPM